MTRGHVLNPIARAELQAFLYQLPLLLHWYQISLATTNSLNKISAKRIQTQYEVENHLDEYNEFKNKDSTYWDDLEMDEMEQGLKEIDFEMKAEQLFHQIRTYQLQ